MYSSAESSTSFAMDSFFSDQFFNYEVDMDNFPWTIPAQETAENQNVGESCSVAEKSEIVGDDDAIQTQEVKLNVESAFEPLPGSVILPPNTITAPEATIAQSVEPVAAEEILSVPASVAVPELVLDESPGETPASGVITPTTEGQLNTPSPTASASRSGVYPCQECGKILSRRDALVRHCRSKHGMGHQYQCEQPRCDKSYVRLRDFKEHMRVIHGRVISAEDARSREQIRGHENVPRATSVGSQRAVPATNANSHLWTAMQAPVAASQLVTNIQQANPSLISQQPIYTQTVQTLPPLYSTPNHLQPSYDQLVQRLSTTASENRLLHQHVVALQQQFQSLRLERDKYATAYVQLRQQMAQQQQQQIGSQGMSHQLGQFGP